MLVGTITDDKRLFDVPKLRVCALRFTETARARIVKVQGTGVRRKALCLGLQLLVGVVSQAMGRSVRLATFSNTQSDAQYEEPTVPGSVVQRLPCCSMNTGACPSLVILHLLPFAYVGWR